MAALPDMNGHTGGVTANTRANTNAGRAGRNGKGREIRQKRERAVAARVLSQLRQRRRAKGSTDGFAQ
ncbi:MAG TPA: hypothetical protein VN845_09550 [Solirubrobacteraceae bacterium]|nr:hypothetical protein [Solirubrobacteraceae bacterium]